jgi:hypothetical protein
MIEPPSSVVGASLYHQLMAFVGGKEPGTAFEGLNGNTVSTPLQPGLERPFVPDHFQCSPLACVAKRETSGVAVDMEAMAGPRV